MKKFSSIVFNLFLFLFLPLVAFMLITAKSPIIGNIRSFVVLSGSMEPALPVGSVVFAQKTSTYGTGDVITFDRGDETVTHRIVSQKQVNGATYFATKGDANNAADQAEVPSERIIGKELFAVPFIGRLVLFMKTLPGFLLFVIVPGVLFVGFEFATIKRELEKEIEKKVLRKLEVSGEEA